MHNKPYYIYTKKYILLLLWVVARAVHTGEVICKNNISDPRMKFTFQLVLEPKAHSLVRFCLVCLSTTMMNFPSTVTCTKDSKNALIVLGTQEVGKMSVEKLTIPDTVVFTANLGLYPANYLVYTCTII